MSGPAFDSAPTMRAATTSERIGDKVRSGLETFAQNPIAKLGDALGMSNFQHELDSYIKPDNEIKYGAMPPPFKMGNMEMQLMDDAVGPSLNASGESMASSEAMSRMRGMKNRGEQYVVRKGGTTRNLIGPEAVDYNPRPGEEHGILDAAGNFRLLTRGTK